MSSVIKVQTDLELQYKKEKYKKRFWSIIIVLIILLIYPTKGISLIPLLTCLSIISNKSKKINIYRSGINGEKLALKLFEKLPKGFTILADIKIDEHSQIDYIILGPTGIFVVEVKNHNGSISGNVNDKQWSQLKVGHRGAPYQNNIYNPIKQVSRQVYHLSEFLKQNNIYFWIQGIIFFTNEGTNVHVANQNKTPIFIMKENRGNDLLKYIQNYRSSKLNFLQKKQIIELLNKNI